MTLQGKYKDTDLFKSLSKAVPKNRLQEARKFAAGFDVKKHTTQTKGQHDTLQFVGALEKRHLLKSHLGDLPTYGSTKKEILEEMMGTGGPKEPDPLVAAAGARRKLKEEETGKMEAKTASEHPGSKTQEAHYLSKVQRAQNVLESRKSAAIVDETIAKRDGKTGAASAGAENRPEKGGVSLATEAIVLPNREGDQPRFDASRMPAAASLQKAEKSGPTALPEKPASASGTAAGSAPSEPAKGSEAVDMDIG